MTTVKSPSIEEIKRRIKERDQKNFKSTVDKNFYPFWEMEIGQTAITRLIPDLNPDNPLPYYLETFSHKISIDGEDKTIACPKTFDRTADCPICERSQKYYRENDKEKGSYYWRKKNSYVRLLIIKNPIRLKDEEGNPVEFEGRVCTSMFGNQILKAIENQLADFDASEPVPWLLDDGYDFLIKKVDAGDGKHADYSFSTFAKRPSAVPDEYRDNIELIDFRDFLPENPGLDKVQHYLDAHDGVVEFQYGKQSSENSSNSTEEDEGRTVKKTKPKVVEEEDEDRPVKAKKTPPSNDDGSESVKLDDSSDDNDLLREILNRKRG